jgi:hypothetical protein
MTLVYYTPDQLADLSTSDLVAEIVRQRDLIAFLQGEASAYHKLVDVIEETMADPDAWEAGDEPEESVLAGYVQHLAMMAYRRSVRDDIAIGTRLHVPTPARSEELLMVLGDVVDRVATGDSLEGVLRWMLPDEDEMEQHPDATAMLEARYRVGNTQGQGGWRFIGHWAPLPTKDTAPL